MNDNIREHLKMAAHCTKAAEQCLRKGLGETAAKLMDAASDNARHAAEAIRRGQ